MGHKMVSVMKSPLLLVGAFMLGAAFSAPAHADGPPFDLPLQCIDDQCDIVHYVDHDPGPGIRDYACGTSTYDGHRGTDFAIPDEATMINGVPITAVADGTVVATRDGVEDIDAARLSPSALNGIECGNGILIDHADGWQSQYCHMRRGSVAVSKGDHVSRGQIIGMVGMSGQATFPHLHFNLRHNKQLVDPFSGTLMSQPVGKDCNPDDGALWTAKARSEMHYAPVHLYGVGFSGARPTAGDIKRGYFNATTLPQDSPELYFWGYVIGAVNGDKIIFKVSGPGPFNGSRTFTVNQPDDAGPRAKWFFVNAKRPQNRWPAGTYHGEVLFSRDGQTPKPIGTAQLQVQ